MILIILTIHSGANISLYLPQYRLYKSLAYLSHQFAQRTSLPTDEVQKLEHELDLAIVTEAITYLMTNKIGIPFFKIEIEIAWKRRDWGLVHDIPGLWEPDEEIICFPMGRGKTPGEEGFIRQGSTHIVDIGVYLMDIGQFFEPMNVIQGMIFSWK